MTEYKAADRTDNEQSFISHLIELRDRLLRIIIAITIATILLFPFSNTIYLYVAAPLMNQLPAGSGMIAVGVTTPFMTPFKLTLLAAVILTIPYTLYQIWGFIAPGLYLRERRLIMPLLLSSTLLFYTGILFVYYLVFPIIFGFVIATAPPGIAVMTDISQYLDFVLALFLAFGIIFEIPIATILLVWMGILTPEMLVGQRSYIIVGAFTIGMFLTPPDPFSQTLLAVPMWLLFEAGVFFSRFFVPNSQLLESTTPMDITVSSQVSEQKEILSALPISKPVFTDTEMEMELDAAEKQEIQLQKDITDLSIEEQMEVKIKQAHALRQLENETGARALLYEVLVAGNAEQRLVAKNILNQIDSN